MEKLFAGALVVLVLLLSPPVAAQDFDKGLKAALSGDYVTALREWKPLAEQGSASAQRNLGNMYFNGHGVPQDDVEAVKWYRKAAEQGLASGQLNLGLMYAKGQGVPQDYVAAVKWYRLAAEQGYASAQYNLGAMYATGRGVPQDSVAAHMWWNLAAAQGDKQAAKNRDFIAKRMTPTGIEKAQRLARECLARNYKNCGR